VGIPFATLWDKTFWIRAQETAEKYYNIKRKEMIFKFSDKIFLSAKNIHIRKFCKKLTDRYLDFF
jgi:hypothetical protein